MPYRGCIRIVIVGLSAGQCPEIIAIVDALSKHTDVSHHQIVSLCQTKGHWPPWKGLAWVFLQTLMFEQKPEKPFVFEVEFGRWLDKRVETLSGDTKRRNIKGWSFFCFCLLIWEQSRGVVPNIVENFPNLSNYDSKCVNHEANPDPRAKQRTTSGTIKGSFQSRGALRMQLQCIGNLQ